MDPFELLKKDHKKVSKLLNQLEKTDEQDSSRRDELFQQIKSELDLHAEIEETIFYPALKQEEETKDITLEAYEEHKEVKTLLQEMASMDSDDETWDAKCKLLKENVEHHVEEEEGEMFKKARKALDRDQLQQLGDQMAQAKGQGGGMTGEEGEEDVLELEMAGMSQSRGSRTGAAMSAGKTSSGRSQASAARSSGSRSGSKSSVKSASHRGGKKRSSSKKSSKKKSSRSKGSKKSGRKSSRRR